MTILARALSALFLLSPLVARADQFVYAASDFVYPNSSNFTFTYVSSHRITTKETVTPLSCTAEGAPCNTLTIDPGHVSPGYQSASITVSGPSGDIGGISDIYPGALSGTGYVAEYDATFNIIDLPQPVPFLYNLQDDMGRFLGYTSHPITSKTTITDFICMTASGSASACDYGPGSSATLDPLAGTITGTGDFAGLDLSGLPPSFFQPGLNQFDYPDAADRALLTVVATGNQTGGATVTPEPSSLLLLGTGVSGMAMLVRRRRRI